MSTAIHKQSSKGPIISAAPGPSSILISADRWCLYPPAHGDPNRRTLNPDVHLDICPWAYPADSRQQGFSKTKKKKVPCEKIQAKAKSASADISGDGDGGRAASSELQAADDGSREKSGGMKEDVSADSLRYTLEVDFRAEIGAVKDETGPHHQASSSIFMHLLVFVFMCAYGTLHNRA